MLKLGLLMKHFFIISLFFALVLLECALFFALVLLECVGATVIELAQGGEIKAEIIQEKPDRIVVDLGFSVMAIPRDSIARMRPVQEPHEEAEDFGKDLYRVEKNPQVESVKEQVDASGEAVVLIRTPTGLGSGFLIHPSGYVV